MRKFLGDSCINKLAIILSLLMSICILNAKDASVFDFLDLSGSPQYLDRNHAPVSTSNYTNLTSTLNRNQIILLSIHTQVAPYVWEREVWDKQYCQEVGITKQEESGKPLPQIQQVCMIHTSVQCRDEDKLSTSWQVTQL